MKTHSILTVKSLDLNDVHVALKSAGFQTILQPSPVQLPASEKKEIAEILGVETNNADLRASASVYSDPNGIIKALDVEVIPAPPRRQQTHLSIRKAIARLARDPIVIVYENQKDPIFPRVKFAIFNAIPLKILSMLLGRNVADILEDAQFKDAMNDIQKLSNIEIKSEKLGEDLLDLIVSSVVDSVTTYVNSMRFELTLDNLIVRDIPCQTRNY